MNPPGTNVQGGRHGAGLTCVESSFVSRLTRTIRVIGTVVIQQASAPVERVQLRPCRASTAAEAYHRDRYPTFRFMRRVEEYSLYEQVRALLILDKI